MASTLKRAYDSNELTERQEKDLNNARAKAVRHAWKQEKEYVRNGMGTRNWTPEQQEDILKNGSVHGFEGHHMRSVSNGKTFEEKMEIAEDKNNIQFLEKTKENNEHLQAHEGDTRNRTNGYYDVRTGERQDFGDNSPEAPKAEKLSNPIAQEKSAEQTAATSCSETEEQAQDTKQEETQGQSEENTQTEDSQQESNVDAYGVDLSQADHSEEESNGEEMSQGG